MLELTPENAGAYLGGRPEIQPERWRVRPLGGGVSNTVLLVESETRRLVLKQALPKLRVQEEWFADRGRNHRECAAMKALAAHLPPGSVPEILFEDAGNCLFAMTAAPPGARIWKSLLLEGTADTGTAEQVAAMLAVMIRVSWASPAWEEMFADRTAFDQLRLDPYYRFTASRHLELAGHFHARIEDARRRCSIVHGDWSPKNFLVSGGSVTAIDFEVIHYGDPSFDAAFLLNHLLLKSFHRPRWASRYARVAGRFREVLMDGLPPGTDWFEPAACRHLGCLLLARIDGKSPAEYIQDEAVRRKVREFARRIIPAPPGNLTEVFDRVPS